MSARPPSKATAHAFAALKQFSGRNSTQATLLFAALGITLGWFGTTLLDLLTASGWQAATTLLGELRSVISLLSFPLLLLLIRGLAMRASGRVPVKVRQYDSPTSVRGLILFLSPPGRDLALLEQDRDSSGHDSKLGYFLHYLKGSWRMPLEAILYHRECLEKVVIIPSADSPGDPPNTVGTYRHTQLFNDTLCRLRPDCSATMLTLPGIPRGVDFEDAEALVDAVEDAYQLLASNGIHGSDALIDITGGQKVGTVAGAAGALADDRQFQYVSTRDFRVHSYDVTYQT